MNESNVLAAPLLPPLPDDESRRAQQAFRRLLPDLLKSYRDEYVAVYQGNVVGHGTDKLAVAGRAYARLGYVPIYVGLVTDQPLPVSRVPSPRVVRPEQAP